MQQLGLHVMQVGIEAVSSRRRSRHLLHTCALSINTVPDADRMCGRVWCVLQGDVVAISPNFNHVLPQIFERPLSFEPDRFNPPRDEDKKKPFSYMGFGGGRHACIGQNFAYLQVSVLLLVVVGCSM